MLKEKFLPGRSFIFFILTLISISIFLAVIVSVSDYITLYLKYPLSHYPLRLLDTLLYYWVFILIGMFVYFIFFLLFLNEFFYRYYNLSFGIFLLMSVIISLFCAWLLWKGRVNTQPEMEIKNTICLIIAGIAYPFISNFWSRKIKFIKLVPTDDEL